jgi:hypothetical protein
MQLRKVLDYQPARGEEAYPFVVAFILPRLELIEPLPVR